MAGVSAGGGVRSREGLFARPGTSDQLQVSVDPGHDFDLDHEIDGLRGQLGKLKEVSSAIAEENKLQRSIADSLEEAMEKARTGLRKTMRRLNRTYEQSKSNHILWLLLFAVGVFVLLYTWIKFYRLVRWIV